MLVYRGLIRTACGRGGIQAFARFECGNKFCSCVHHSYSYTHAMISACNKRGQHLVPAHASSSKDTNTEVDTRRGDNAPNLASTTTVLLFHAVCAIGLAIRCGLNRHIWGPSNAADKVLMCLIHHLDTFAFLRQIPAPDGLVIRDGKQITTGRVKYQTSDPIVMTHQSLVAGAPVVPDLDDLVSATSGQELTTATRWRRLLVAGNGSQMRVSRAGSERNALDDMLMTEECDFHFARTRVP
jgi:hypothetical protein